MALLTQQVLLAVLLLLGLLIEPPAATQTIVGQVSASESGGGLPDVVVSVEDIEQPSAALGQLAVVEQKELHFVPHVLVIQVGTTVEFPNRDPLSHNVFSISSAKRFNLGLYRQGATRRLRFDVPGAVELLCNVHIEMSGYIVVVKNPYFARTGPDGSYRISGVPVGRHRLRYWHERFPSQERPVDVPETGLVRLNVLMGE